MDRDSIRHQYATWGVYTCVKCTWRAITHARLARRGALRTPLAPPIAPLVRSTGHSMSKRPRINGPSAPILPHDNRVNDTETHSELLQLRLELAQRPLSAHDYHTPTSVTSFALRISSAKHIRHRPRGNSIHPCMATILGQTLPYGTPPISYCVEDVTVHLDQYTVWAYDITKRDFVLGDIIHVCRQFHYTLPDLQLLAQSIRRHSLSLTSPAATASWSTNTHLTSTRCIYITTDTGTVASNCTRSGTYLPTDPSHSPRS
jgi:hypothetical protein